MVNMYCSDHKTSTDKYRKGWDRVFLAHLAEKRSIKCLENYKSIKDTNKCEQSCDCG